VDGNKIPYIQRVSCWPYGKEMKECLEMLYSVNSSLLVMPLDLQLNGHGLHSAPIPGHVAYTRPGSSQILVDSPSKK